MPEFKTITVKAPCRNCFGFLYYTDNSGPEPTKYACLCCDGKGWDYAQIDVLDEKAIPGEE